MVATIPMQSGNFSMAFFVQSVGHSIRALKTCTHICIQFHCPVRRRAREPPFCHCGMGHRLIENTREKWNKKERYHELSLATNDASESPDLSEQQTKDILYSCNNGNPREAVRNPKVSL